MRTVFVQFLKWFGWLALAGSVGVVVVAVIWQAPAGPTANGGPELSARLWRSFGHTVWMAAAATGLAVPAAALAAIGLIGVTHPGWRAAARCIVVLPLITMPATFAYGWQLLATRPGAPTTILTWLGWNTPGREPLAAAWAMATWLWPIPAVVLALSYRQLATGPRQMASLDLGPAKTLVHVVFRLLFIPFAASCAIVFALAAMDSTIPPLVGAAETYSVELLAAASVAARQDRPVGYLFWQSWPIMALMVMAGLVAWPAARQLAAQDGEVEVLDLGTGLVGRRRWSKAALAVAAVISFGPIAVYCVELAAGRPSAGAALIAAYHSCRNAGAATTIAAAGAFLTSIAAGLAIVGRDDGHVGERVLKHIAIASSMAVALMPPELIGTAIGQAYMKISPARSWNLYDDTPWVWIAGMLARFGFIPVCVAAVADRRVPREILALALTDGAGPIQRLIHARLPFVLRPLVAASMMVGCLTVSEVAVSLLVQPTRFLGGSLAVAVDQQMHYGRNNETIASSLMMTAAAVVLVAGWSLLMERRRPRRAPAMRLFATLAAIALFGAAGCDESHAQASAVRSVFGQTGLGLGEFSYPRGIAVSPIDGCIFVVDKTARIQRFSPDGRPETEWHTPEWDYGKPTGLSIDNSNRVWVPDTHYARVLVYDRDGHELFRFGSHGEGPGQFVFPTCVLLDAEGYIYVGEYGGNDRISKFTPQHEYVSSFGDRDSGEAALNRPTELLWDETGVMWVADGCNHRICRFDRSGKFLSAFEVPGMGEFKPSFPYGMALEPAGTILIADHGNNRILRMDRKGAVLATWGRPGRAVGEIMQPWDLARGRDGTVFVLDSWNNRVQVLNW